MQNGVIFLTVIRVSVVFRLRRAHIGAIFPVAVFEFAGVLAKENPTPVLFSVCPEAFVVIPRNKQESPIPVFLPKEIISFI